MEILDLIKQDWETAQKNDKIFSKEISWNTWENVYGLIDRGNINLTDSWSFSEEDKNKALGINKNDWGSYSNIHLGKDIKYERNDVKRYFFPVIKDGTVFKSALLQAKQDALKNEQTQWMAYSIDRVLGFIARKFEDFTGDNKNDNSPNMKQGNRADFMFEEFMTDTFTRTPEGFLTGQAVITNVGVFSYRNRDGSIIKELRLPEEVFHPDSINSLKMSPLTNDHPSEQVNSENAKELSVGFIGDRVKEDSYHLSAPITITDADAVNDVKNKGKKALSAGYSVDLEMKSGTWMGVKYDAIQRNIRYNHVAIVDRGRAGDDAVIKLDSVDAISVNVNIDKNKNENNSKKEDTHMPDLKKVKIHDVEYDAEAKVIETLSLVQEKNDKLNTDMEALKTDKATVEAERDTLKEQNEQLKKDMEKLEKEHPGKIDSAVQSRIDLIHKVEKCGVEVTDGMSEVDMKKAVIVKASPNIDQKKLDEAETAYLDARFDGAVEILIKAEDNANKNDKKVAGDSPNGDSPNGEVNADAAREKMIDRMTNASKESK